MAPPAVCGDSEWPTPYKPNEADEAGVVAVDGVTIDFITASEQGEQGGGLVGIESISDATATVWVKESDLNVPVMAADLPFLTTIGPGGQHEPIVQFGVCVP